MPEKPELLDERTFEDREKNTGEIIKFTIKLYREGKRYFSKITLDCENIEGSFLIGKKILEKTAWKRYEWMIEIIEKRNYHLILCPPIYEKRPCIITKSGNLQRHNF